MTQWGPLERLRLAEIRLHLGLERQFQLHEIWLHDARRFLRGKIGEAESLQQKQTKTKQKEQNERKRTTRSSQ